jgi:hypothetical protein
VSFIEVAKVNIHAVLVKIASGQLPFLGSTRIGHFPVIPAFAAGQSLT